LTINDINATTRTNSDKKNDHNAFAVTTTMQYKVIIYVLAIKLKGAKEESKAANYPARTVRVAPLKES